MGLMVVVPSECRVGHVEQLRRCCALHVAIAEDYVAVPPVPQGEPVKIASSRVAAPSQELEARPKQPVVDESQRDL